MTKEQTLRNNTGLIPFVQIEKAGPCILRAMEEYAEQQAAAAFQSARERTTTPNGMIHFDSGDTTPHYPYAFGNYEEYKKIMQHEQNRYRDQD